MKNKILRYALKNRKTANMNPVGKNLSILTVFLSLFLINFAILIGRKFGVDLVAEPKSLPDSKNRLGLY